MVFLSPLPTKEPPDRSERGVCFCEESVKSKVSKWCETEGASGLGRIGRAERMSCGSAAGAVRRKKRSCRRLAAAKD